MKPDAWIQSNHLPVKAAAMCRLADHKLMSDFLPLYSAATIRKWLSEDMSDAVMKCLGPPHWHQAEAYRAIIAAKLEELK